MSDSDTPGPRRKQRRSPLPPEMQPANRHAPTPLEQQRLKLAKLLQDPSKEVYIPPSLKEKGIRAPREMIKNVQGSSAGAGSGEFHVYKQSRRREYERLKLMDEKEKRDHEAAEFAKRQAERVASADARTAKNRAKRARKKASRNKHSAKGKGKAAGDGGAGGPSEEESDSDEEGGGVKKRRLANASGPGVTFRKGEEDDDEEGDEPDGAGRPGAADAVMSAAASGLASATVAVQSNGLTIVADD